VLLGLLLAGLVAGALLYATEAGKVAVPGVIGAPSDRARTLLEQQGFDVNVERKASLQPVDQVIEQDPGAGSKARKGSTVTLTVSDGPPNKVVPTVDGLPLRVGLNKLRRAGFKVDVNPKASDEVKKGLIIETSPQGGTLDQVGDRITVYVSSGVATFNMPDVVALDQDTAERSLEDQGLVPVVVQKESSKDQGTVIAQDPVAGTKVSKGDRVTITVSKGPGTAEVPDTVGLTQGDARGEIGAAGFKVQVRERAVQDEADDGLVVDQRPAAGGQLKKGRTVVIWVGKFTAPTPTQTTPTPTTPGITPPAGGIGD
jgi:serine/threonine-protein kinase